MIGIVELVVFDLDQVVEGAVGNSGRGLTGKYLQQLHLVIVRLLLQRDGKEAQRLAGVHNGKKDLFFPDKRAFSLQGKEQLLHFLGRGGGTVLTYGTEGELASFSLRHIGLVMGAVQGQHHVQTGKEGRGSMKDTVGDTLHGSQMIDLGKGIHDGGKAILVAADGAHLANGLDAGFHQQLQLVETVTFFVVTLDIQRPDGLDGGRHAFVAGEQNDEQLFVELPDLLHHLVAADGGHQKVQQQDVIVSVSDALNGGVGVVFRVHPVTGALEIGLNGGSHDGVIVQGEDGERILI